MNRENILINTPVISEDLPLVKKGVRRPYTYRGNVFVIGNDIDFMNTLVKFIEGLGHNVLTCDTPETILSCSRQLDCDVFLLDLSLKPKSNINFVSFIRQKFPYGRLILIYEIDQIEEALEGIKQGAYFYIPKSCNPSDIAELVHKAILDRYRNQVYESSFESILFEELAGNNPQMRRVVEIIRKVAPTDSTVLILGESGVGKEIVAQILHRLSPRRDKPFIAINCAALPETLLESELFGHVQGAFTGAERDKRGLFAEADGGSIFLDEIGDMSISTQAKLLRVLQNGEIRPVGSNTVQKVNVRVISATNKDLLKAVGEKTFREDLYYRLNVVQIRVPPLRERKDALPALIQHFINRYNHRYGKNIQGVEDSAMAILRAYNYPGNVRELESIVAHAVIMADGIYILRKDLPEYLLESQSNLLALPSEDSDGVCTLAELEAKHIRRVLEKFNYNQSESAKALGISRSTLWRKIKQYNIILPNS
ncbi:MAG: sigma-54 dependent transcriptional regulator [Candidatus Hydrogenedentes bacterium]|nr:sigma-54 dependent transcriptional regulator [Candidatus Hydrogenedentota bacterium]